MKHLTVVYTIGDDKKFADEMDKLSQRFSVAHLDVTSNGWAITAMSTDNEVRRIELIEEAVDNGDLEILNAIISHSDIGNIRTLDEL